MADELEKPSFEFNIQETMERGMGDQTILNDLLGPETSTGNPEELTPIIKDAEPPIPAKKPDVPKGKEIVPVEEGAEPNPQDAIYNFLGDNDEPTDDEGETSPPVSVDKPVDEEPSDDKVSQFTTLSTDLFKLGVFTTEEGDEESPIVTGQEFLDRFNAEKQKGAIEVVNKFIGQFGQDYQDAFDAIYVKGVNPKDYFGVYNNIVDFTNLNMTVEENQIAVVKQMMSDQGMEPEDITTEVERLKNYGDLEAVSAKYHKVLVKKDTARLAKLEEDAEREIQQKSAVKNQYIQNVQTVLQEKLKTKEFDGIPINPKLANELHDFLLVDKYKTPSGELLTEFDRVILDLKRPENHSTKVKIALLLKILEKDPTLSTIQRTGVSKKANELFSETIKQVSKPKELSTTNPLKTWNL